MSPHRVSVYDGDGDCILDVLVVASIEADWLTDFLRGVAETEGLAWDVYDDENVSTGRLAMSASRLSSTGGEP